jgi:hypothetical protein
MMCADDETMMMDMMEPHRDVGESVVGGVCRDDD